MAPVIPLAAATPELQMVRTALGALPRTAAPPSVTRAVRREVARIRRRLPADEIRDLWPTAVSVQIVLLAALWALYLVATPPAVVVDRGPAATSESSPSRRANTRSPTDISRQSQPNTGPTTR
jgi:hypothetical protein